MDTDSLKEVWEKYFYLGGSVPSQIFTTEKGKHWYYGGQLAASIQLGLALKI